MKAAKAKRKRAGGSLGGPWRSLVQRSYLTDEGATLDVLGRYEASHTRELALYLSWLAVASAEVRRAGAAAAQCRHGLPLPGPLLQRV
jgi:hypothetical protein